MCFSFLNIFENKCLPTSVYKPLLFCHSKASAWPEFPDYLSRSHWAHNPLCKFRMDMSWWRSIYAGCMLSGNQGYQTLPNMNPFGIRDCCLGGAIVRVTIHTWSKENTSLMLHLSEACNSIEVVKDLAGRKQDLKNWCGLKAAGREP